MTALILAVLAVAAAVCYSATYDKDEPVASLFVLATFLLTIATFVALVVS